MPDVWTAFALLAIVLVVSALLSGVVERLPITFPMIFLALGVVLMPLPGPGAVVVVLGMVILATQFEWADRRLDKVKAWAMKGAADSVRTWPRILLSLLGVVWLHFPRREAS